MKGLGAPDEAIVEEGRAGTFPSYHPIVEVGRRGTFPMYHPVVEEGRLGAAHALGPAQPAILRPHACKHMRACVPPFVSSLQPHVRPATPYKARRPRSTCSTRTSPPRARATWPVRTSPWLTSASCLTCRR
eukprot:scaffold132613_cov57-Phaeocystis_antarctica.AAC.1